jgi:hypothetical protein
MVQFLKYNLIFAKPKGINFAGWTFPTLFMMLAAFLLFKWLISDGNSLIVFPIEGSISLWPEF